MSTASEILWLVAVLALCLVVYGVARRRTHRRRHEPPKPLVVAPKPRTDDESESLVEEDVGTGPQPIGPLVIVRRAGTTRYPIVLAHGYFGFDTIGAWRIRHEYFRGVRAALEARGYRVHVPRVSPAASVSQRALELGSHIDRITAARVNVIAHSMGGLDARFAISQLGLDTRVASLTTIGTPHHGTPLADSTLTLLGGSGAVRGLFTLLRGDGFFDLTTSSMALFNNRVPDGGTVEYASVIGAVSKNLGNVHRLLAPGYSFLRQRWGPNDGIVTADSQRWGLVLNEVEADHWAQIGWSRGLNVAAFYQRLADDLAKRGL